MENIDSQNETARNLRQEKSRNKNWASAKNINLSFEDYSKSSISNEKVASRLKEAQARSRIDNMKSDAKRSKLAQKISGRVSSHIQEKLGEGSERIFYVLLMVAMAIDLLEYLDLGFFSAIVNLGIYMILLVGGVMIYFAQHTNSILSIQSLLKRQMWKYLIMPLLEMIPLVNLLPFWTATVLMMLINYKKEKAKIMHVSEKDKNKKQLQEQYA